MELFKKRRKQLKSLFDNNDINCDAVFIDSPENLYYYTGFTGGEAVFIINCCHNNTDACDNGESVSHNNFDADNAKCNNKSDLYKEVISKYGMCIVTDSRYYEQVEKECPDIPLIKLNNHTYIEVIKDLLAYSNYRFSDTINRDYWQYNSKEKLPKRVNKYCVNVEKIETNYDANCRIKVAVEDTMKLSRYLKLTDSLPWCEFKVVGEIINKPRMVKDDDEIAIIRRAEEIGDEAFDHILGMIRPGMSEREISLELEFFMKRQGASKLSFDTIVASGPNSSMPHAQVTDRVIQNGDFVTMDFGCVYKGYCSDMTRTIAVGNPTDEMKKVYRIVLEANKLAMEGIKEGVKCSDIDALAREYIKSKGYGEYFGHGLGHSVGLYIHEEPRFSPKCDTITKENMVITDEPGIYLPGKFGVRIEDLVVVKKDGYEVLSHSPKELINV